MRFKKPIIAATTVGLLALAACGGSGNGGNGGGGGAGGVDKENLGNTGDATDPTREGPVEIDGAKEGGTVTVLSFSGLNSMDPTEAYYTNTASILSGLITRSLTQYVYDEESGNMVLVPDLATDLGTPNEDFTEWKFTIRDGVKWENGQDVTADDVAYGIMRSFDRASFPEGAAYSNDYFIDGDKYKGPYKSGTDYAGVSVDGNTLTLKMNKPFPDMPYWGAFPAIGPVPEGKDDPDKYRLHPWATGPYMFDEYTPEKSLTLVRNPHWDPATDPGRTAYPEKYVFDFQTDNSKIDQILLNDQGEGQTTLTFDDVLAENFRTFQDEESDRLILGGQPCTFYWGLDYRKIKDIKVRQALAYAYPYEDAILAGGYIKDVTRINGTNLLPPGIPGREEFNPMPDHEVGTTDTAKAKSLLEEAGETGFEVKWLFANDDPNAVKVKDVIVRSLKEAGFTPKPVASTIADLSTVRADPDADINVRSAGWCSDWPSGGSWFPPVLQSTNLEEEGLGSNYSVFSEKDVDDRINEVLQAPIEDQPTKWNELDKYIAEKYMPLFVTGYAGVAQAHGSKINGHDIDNTFGMPTWKDIWVS